MQIFANVFKVIGYINTVIATAKNIEYYVDKLGIYDRWISKKVKRKQDKAEKSRRLLKELYKMRTKDR